MKKIISALLALAMLFSCLTTVTGLTVFATGEETEEHVYFDRVIPATTTHMGYTIHECTVCGECYTDSYVDALVDTTEVVGYSYAVRAQHVVNNPYNASTAKPFANLNFGDGDYCSVTLKLINNTDAVFKGIALAQAYGTSIRYYEGETLKTYSVNPTYDGSAVDPGESLTITISIPREAYYANGGTGTTSGSADGLGVICTYDKVDLRACFATAPKSGSLAIIPLDHTEILTSLASYKLGGTAATEFKFSDYPDEYKQTILRASATELEDGKTYIDLEGADDASYMKSWGGTGSGISTEQALTGSYSFKQTGGTADYHSAAIKAAALTNVIDGEGTYRVSGYIYVETLPSYTSMNINLRQTNSTYYHTQGSGIKLDETYVGVWKRFECIYTLPGEIAEATGAKLQPDWLSKMESLAFDSIGNGSTFYLDNLCVEKVTREGYSLTFNGCDETEEKVNYSFSRCAAGITSLEDGAYEYTYRLYNIGTATANVHLCLMGGDRPSDPGNIGWDYQVGESGSDFIKLEAGQWVDLTVPLTVQDGAVTFVDSTTKEEYTDSLSTLYLRLDIKEADLDNVNVKLLVTETGDTKLGTELVAPYKGSKANFYSDEAELLGIADYVEAGHTWVIENVAPTCIEQGYTRRYCSDDGCDKEFKYDYVDALGHTPVTDAAVEPTCTATGLTEGSHCSVCQAVLTAQEDVPALGHIYNGLYASKAATETEDGYDIKYCSRCGNYNATMVSSTGETKAITGATYTFSYSWCRTAFGISTTDGTDNGKVTPFKDLTFGTGDTCDVTFLIVNNTNVKLNTVSLANSWGYNCFLTEANAAAGTKFTGGQVSCGIEAGASKTITLTVPRTAYYANAGKATTDGKGNDGCGYICGYENVGLRFDLSATPSSGTVTFYCLTDSTVAANMVNTPSLGGITSVTPSYVALTSDVSDDGAFLDFESLSDGGLYYALANSASSVVSTEQAFTGTHSLKVTCNGTWGYENVALDEDTVNAVITEAGTYCYSGWIYFETLPSSVTDAGKSWCGNLRDKDGYHYQSVSSKLYPANQGVWMPFAFTFIVEEESKRFYDSSAGAKVTTAPIGNLKSIAFDQIGVGAVYYIDNVRLEKVESGFYGRQLTYNTNASSNQGYYAGYVVTSNPSALGVGEHTLTYRVYNYSDYDAKINMRLDNGWSMNSVSRAEDAAKKGASLSIVARSYRDITLKFTVNEDGTVSGNNAENVTISKLVLRLDMYDANGTTTFNGIGSAMSMIFVDTTTDAAVTKLNEMSKFGAGATITDITISNDARIATMATFPETHDHVVVTDAAVKATCTTTGLTEGSHCSVCNRTLVAQTVTAIDSGNHTGLVNDAAVAATCTSTGLTAGSHCTACNSVVVSQQVTAVDSSNHTNVVTDAAVAATCHTTGLTEGSHCEACLAVVVAQETVPFNCENHTNIVTDEAVEATCHTTGLTAGSHCADCLAVVVAQEETPINPENHTNIVDDEAVEATCISTGLTAGSHCAACLAVVVAQEETPINPENHTNIVTDKAVAATCHTTGLTEGSHCADCQTVFTAQEVIDYLEHTPGEEANYTHDQVCTVCGAVLKEKLTMPAGECGEGVIWQFNPDNGTLYISGSGAMVKNSDSYRQYADTITAIEIGNGITAVPAGAFKNLTALETVTMDDTVTSIGANAFENCTALTGVTLSDTITVIPQMAFAGCSALTEFTTPAGVTKISENAFKDCVLLAEFDFASVSVIESYAFTNCGFEILTLPETLTDLSDYAFANCELLTELTIAGGLKNTGNYVFSGCTALKLVTINEGVETIGEYIFANTPVETVVIANSVELISQSAFQGCSALTNLTIGEGIREIGSSAFAGCTSITSIVFPALLESIDGSAFYGCEGLTEIYVNGNITVISGSAFEHCTSLAKVTLYNGVQKVYGYAFKGCTALKNIYIANSVDFISDKAFDGCTDLTIHCYRNSAAETYAGENSYAIAYIEDIIGDINGDGGITEDDVTAFTKYLSNWTNYQNCTAFANADINDDGKVTPIDRAILARYVAGWDGYDQYFA